MKPLIGGIQLPWQRPFISPALYAGTVTEASVVVNPCPSLFGFHVLQ